MNEFLSLAIWSFMATKYLSIQSRGDTNGGLMTPFKISKIISESTPERILVAFAAKTTIKFSSQLKTVTNDGTKTG